MDEDKLQDEVLEDMEEEQNAEEVSDDDVAEIVPALGTKDWQDYIMRQFYEYELDSEGNPNCNGCRRLVRKFIGFIETGVVRDFVAPNTQNKGTATVVFEVVIHIKHQDHPDYGMTIQVSDIADVNKWNTDPPYNKHASATAATRAEGRIYRKLLGINKITAEEASEVASEEMEAWDEDGLIEDGQINIIDMMCKRSNVNVLEFVNCGKNEYMSVDIIPKGVATTMIQKLNSIQQGSDSKPKGVGNYDPNWREAE